MQVDLIGVAADQVNYEVERDSEENGVTGDYASVVRKVEGADEEFGDAHRCTRKSDIEPHDKYEEAGIGKEKHGELYFKVEEVEGFHRVCFHKEESKSRISNEDK